jgi:hypothetical protein
MGKVSQSFRDQAARVLHASRHAHDGTAKAVSVYIAMAYKALALDEETLRGEPQRSRKRRDNGADRSP